MNYEWKILHIHTLVFTARVFAVVVVDHTVTKALLLLHFLLAFLLAAKAVECEKIHSAKAQLAAHKQMNE